MHRGNGAVPEAENAAAVAAAATSVIVSRLAAELATAKRDVLDLRREVDQRRSVAEYANANVAALEQRLADAQAAAQVTIGLWLWSCPLPTSSALGASALA